MQDTILNGSGTSRSLKIPASKAVVYQDISAMVQDMVDGNFLFDIGPTRLEGVAQKGTDLNKSTLLSDETAAAYGRDNTAVPNEILMEPCKIGDIIFPSARAKFQSSIGPKFMPANGQILNAADYPELAKAFGEMPVGYDYYKIKTNSGLSGVNALFQTNTGRVLAYTSSGTNAGVYVSDNLGDTFRYVFSGLSSYQIVDFFYSAHSDKIILVTVSAVFWSTDDGETWTQVYQGNMGAYVKCMQTQSGRLFVSDRQSTKIKYSDDDGATWAEINGPGGNVLEIESLSNNSLIMVTRRGGAGTQVDIRKSTDDGMSWAQLHEISGFSEAVSYVKVVEFENKFCIVYFYGGNAYASIDFFDSIFQFKDTTQVPKVDPVRKILKTGGSNIFSPFYISRDFGFTGTNSKFSTNGSVSSAAYVLLDNGDLLVAANHSDSIWYWWWSRPTNDTIFVPNVPGSFIRYR